MRLKSKNKNISKWEFVTDVETRDQVVNDQHKKIINIYKHLFFLFENKIYICSGIDATETHIFTLDEIDAQHLLSSALLKFGLITDTEFKQHAEDITVFNNLKKKISNIDKVLEILTDEYIEMKNTQEYRKHLLQERNKCLSDINELEELEELEDGATKRENN